MDDAWEDWYNWRNGRWEGLEQAAQSVLSEDGATYLERRR
jgi:hypothetical protein